MLVIITHWTRGADIPGVKESKRLSSVRWCDMRMQLAACHPTHDDNFEVVPIFWKTCGVPVQHCVITYCTRKTLQKLT